MRIIILIAILAIPSLLISQKVILPKESKNYVYEISSNNELILNGEIDFPISRLIEVSKNEIAFCIDTAQHKLLISNISDTKSSNFIVEQVKIPKDINPISIITHKNLVFIGGDWDSEKLYKYDNQEKKWDKVFIPKEFQVRGKSIDDFLILNDTLIALDNIVTPKYLLFYDLKKSNEVNYIKKYLIPPNGAYESLHRIEFLNNHFVVLSTTYHGGSQIDYYLTVLQKDNLPDLNKYYEEELKGLSNGKAVQELEEYNGFVISSSYTKRKLRRQKLKTVEYPIKWVDIVVKDEKLLVATNKEKIGELNIKTEYFENNPSKKAFYWDFNKEVTMMIDHKEMKYSRLRNKKAKWFVKILDTNFVFLVFESNNGEINFEKI